MLDQTLDAVNIRTVFGRKRNVELPRDHSPERNELHRGYTGLKETGIQILGQIYWLPIYFEVFGDERSETFCG